MEAGTKGLGGAVATSVFRFIIFYALYNESMDSPPLKFTMIATLGKKRQELHAALKDG